MQATTIALAEEKKRRPELRDEDLQAFRDWADKQPHLPAVTGDPADHLCGQSLLNVWQNTAASARALGGQSRSSLHRS